MEPITREEYYLAKIAGTWQGKTPEPVTIEEYYLATMAGDYSGNTPQPVTRLQYYMAKAAGAWKGSIPEPVTRLEYYWAAIANGEGTVFQPVTREEHFLALIADAYSVVIRVVTGNPALLEGVKGSRFTSLAIYGKSTQGSTTGAQLVNLPDTNAAIHNGITWECKNGIITANGTTTATVASSRIVGVNGTLKLPAGDYYLSGTNKNISVYISIKKEDGSYEYYTNSFSVDEEKTITVFAQIYGVGVTVNNEKVYIMLNSGSTALPWEPYTGGAPSPSPSYPQEIESAGDKGQVDISILGANLAFGNKSGAANDAVAYLYGLQKFYIKAKRLSGTSQVNCRFHYENGMTGDDIYILTKGESRNEVIRAVDAKYPVKHIAIYAVGVSGDNPITELEYLMVNPENIPYEPYKPAQTLIIPTPGGLPGIPVSSGGNYTDAEGQQWVADEIDLAKGERVQWVYHRHYASDELLYRDNMNFNIYTYKSEDVNIIDDTKHILVNVGRYNPAFAQNNNYRGVTGGLRGRVDDIKSENDIKNVFPNGIDVWFIRKTPIRTPLPPETIAAYKKLHTYSPTTTVINDAGAGMSVGYAKMK